MAVLDIFRFASVFAAGIAAGTLVAVLAGVLPVLVRLPPAEALRTKRMLDPLIDRYQPATVILAAVSAVVILFHHLSSSETVFTVIGLVGAIGVGVTSGSVNMRINRTMGAWPADAVPAEFAPLLARWGRFHLLRTVFALVALAAFALAVVRP
ncbi:MAG TPA: anthrone oxygenase family protein [Solirubrobacteraceae bacterium]|jgi:uncharacterized membrane protein|nr:anthrone oxygenase family protein [Solirubrobacteraceae bacterium]